MSNTVAIAVGCAVGIPIVLGILVTFVFWYRMQQKFKREREHDTESLNEQICYMNAQVLHDEDEYKRDSIIEGSRTGSGSALGSSDDNLFVERNEERKESEKGKSVYVPAYKKKLQSVIASNTKLCDEQNSRRNSENSNSIAIGKRSNSQVTIFDKMIPVMPDDNISGNFFQTEDQEDSSNKRIASNETLIKSINTFDLGAYPRRASFTQLSSTVGVSKTSVISLQTSVSEHSPEKTTNDVSGIPNSGKFMEVAGEASPTGMYNLKNNYDMANSSLIAEEDQYENEFTNYSENKREFIDSLRPKKVQVNK